MEVFHFEQGLDEIVAEVADRTGLTPPAQLPHEMRSASGMSVSWDRDDEIRVEETYARDFSEFGYGLRAPLVQQETAPEPEVSQ